MPMVVCLRWAILLILTSARYSNSIGQAEFAVHWTDPDFDPQHSAFYYARILQIPTPRNALFDARALGLDKPPKGPVLFKSAPILRRFGTSPKAGWHFLRFNLHLGINWYQGAIAEV